MIKWYLAFQPWRSEEDGAAYDRAVKSTWIPPYSEPIPPFEPFGVGAEGGWGDTDTERVFDMFDPGLGSAWVEHFKVRSEGIEDLTVGELISMLRGERGHGAEVERKLSMLVPDLDTFTADLREALLRDLTRFQDDLTVREFFELTTGRNLTNSLTLNELFDFVKGNISCPFYEKASAEELSRRRDLGLLIGDGSRDLNATSKEAESGEAKSE